MSSRLKVFLALYVLVVSAVCCVATRAAEPELSDLSPPPEAAYVVSQCGEVVVLWLLHIEPDGHLRAYRTDNLHHPDSNEEYNAFLKWVARTPKDHMDVYELPCPTKKATP
jgi:hypothetical protein